MPALVALWCVAALLALALAAIGAARTKVGSFLVYGGSLIASLGALSFGMMTLIEGAPAETMLLPVGLPGLGAHFRVDALSAFFLVVANLGGAAASLYGIGYGRHEKAPLRVLPFFPAYLAGMNLVVLADDAFSFLIAWEFMSLSSWALVMANHRAPENARAGYIYLVMASFGTLALLLAFGLLAGAGGDYAFAAMRANHPAETTGLIVLLLALLGAGSKAGLVPLHVWLPLAHPAAPSHVSALMSGVMTKIAVYGFIRIVFDLVGEPVWWSSMIVLALAGITTVLGVLYALMQHDLKRLLAYHTVENIGIIFIGIGLAMAFRASNMSWAAALALTAALFHVLNHSIFKSLLFFGAGAVSSATGERNMEHLGGLIHRMPKTAVAFLIGCVAISALPPLNGFVSEWLTFQAILVSPQISQIGPALYDPRGRRAAGAFGGAGRRVLRQSLRRHLPRQATNKRRRNRQRDRRLLARRDVRPRSAMRDPGRRAGRGGRTDLAGGGEAGRRPHAGAVLFAVVVARSDRREPQLLQRPHYPLFPCGIRHRHRPVHPSLRDAGDAAQRDLGLWLSRCLTRHAIHQFKLRDADPPGVRHDGVWRSRDGRYAAPRRHARGALSRQGARSGLALCLRAGGALDAAHYDEAQSPPISVDP